jgi:hypothetical protein
METPPFHFKEPHGQSPWRLHWNAFLRLPARNPRPQKSCGGKAGQGGDGLLRRWIKMYHSAPNSVSEKVGALTIGTGND